MVRLRNFVGENKNIRVVEEKGIFKVIEHERDLSVSPHNAQTAYFMAEMGLKQKQVLITLEQNAIRLKPGAMQFMTGSVSQETGITGVGDLAGKLLRGKMTGDAPIKPLYKGNGIVVTEPTYLYPIIEDVREWGGLVCDDGMFICCDDEVKDSAVMRSNLSSAALGNEGLFNLVLRGAGYAVLNSICPRQELYLVELQDDCIKIDGNNAVCWSESLKFTVERSGKSLIGSAASGEGLVNTYRGTGRILMAPRV